MTYSGFHILFEKIAMKEVRSLTLRGHADVPDGDYVFMPMYCDDKTCDCRRAIIQVYQVSPKQRQFPAASISYGWESMAFYRKWSHHLSDDLLLEFKGPALDRMAQQSPFAEALLKHFIVNSLDEVYIERLKRQYAMFKYKKGMKLPPQVSKHLSIYEPCPCGSGKKFNLCCGKVSFFKRRFK